MTYFNSVKFLGGRTIASMYYLPQTRKLSKRNALGYLSLVYKDRLYLHFNDNLYLGVL